MRLYNRYLTTLALLFTGTAVLFAVYNQQQISIYFSIYVVEYLALTLLFTSLHPRARGLINLVGYILFAGFLGVITLRAAIIVMSMGLLA
jgi:hypothetical protein